VSKNTIIATSATITNVAANSCSIKRDEENTNNNDLAIHSVESDRLYETFLRLLLYRWPGMHLRSCKLWSAARNKLTCWLNVRNLLKQSTFPGYS